MDQDDYATIGSATPYAAQASVECAQHFEKLCKRWLEKLETKPKEGEPVTGHERHYRSLLADDSNEATRCWIFAVEALVRWAGEPESETVFAPA